MNCRIAGLLALVAGAANALPVTLTWTAPTGVAPNGYIVGFGEVSRTYTTTVDVGTALSYTVDALTPGRTYYVSVKSYGAAGSSEWTNEIAIAVLDAPSESIAVSPVVGLWDNADEPGSGYSIDFKHGVLVVLVFSYAPDGNTQWYIASGPLDGSTFKGRLDKFVGGPCISCAFTSGPSAAGSDGDITIVFGSPTSATVYLPGGKVTPIRPTMF